MKEARRAVLLVVLPLVVGVLGYAAWRSEEIRLVHWLAYLLPRAVRTARSGGAALGLPRVVVGVVPDLAWAFAFGACLTLVWRGRTGAQGKVWIGAGFVVALGCELGQAWGLLPGTFDRLDLVAIAVGYAGGALLSARETAHRPRPAPSRGFWRSRDR